MKYFNKTAAIIIVTTALTACGGGGGGGSSDSSNTVDSNNYVSGEFKSLIPDTDGSLTYSNDVGLEYQCMIGSPDRYFESADVIVLADAYVGDDDFKYAATIVQNNIPVALSKIGYSKQEYLNEKRSYLSNDYLNYFGQLFVGNGFFGEGEFSDENTYVERARIIIDAFGGRDAAMNFFSSFGSVGEFNTRMEGYYANKTDEELVSDARLVEIENGIDPEYGNSFKARYTKTVVCLEDSRSDFNWGEGTVKGMKIAPKSIASRSDDAQVVVHELIHHLQMVFSGQFSEESKLERWFAEGQAVFLSGQKVTSGNHSRNPTNVLNIIEEGNNYSDTGLAYEDYGQAYKYLEDNYGQESVRAMFKGMQEDKESGGDDLLNELPSFEIQFSIYLTDIDEFKMNYPNLNK